MVALTHHPEVAASFVTGYEDLLRARGMTCLDLLLRLACCQDTAFLGNAFIANLAVNAVYHMYYFRKVGIP